MHDLRSEENKAAFSFLTFSQINSTVIPEIDALLEELNKKIIEIGNKDQEQLSNEDKSIEVKHGFLTEAKIRWTGFTRHHIEKTWEIITKENKISH